MRGESKNQNLQVVFEHVFGDMLTFEGAVTLEECFREFNDMTQTIGGLKNTRQHFN